MLKDPAWYAPPPFGSQIIVANNEDHSRFRRTLSHAFSEKALAQQEGLLQSYVDLLVNRMKEVISTAKGPQDMSRWFNWTTFDIIADLTFGESFECLETLSTNKYIPVLFASLAAFRLNYLFYYWPFARRFKSLFFSAASLQGRADFYQWIASQTQKRIERDTERPDFMTEILKHNGEKGQELSERELANNASVMMGAGSETTATLLSGATFCLLKNPDVMQKLKDDVRGQWKNYGDITLDEVNKSHYLLAVLQEALRYFPPVPTGFERKVPPGGDVVSGYYIPEGTALSVSSWPSGHSERNFKDPDAFVPERWMGDPRYEDDNRDAIQPFSFGPRNCLGKVSQTAAFALFPVALHSLSTSESYVCILTSLPHRTSHMPRCVSSSQNSSGRSIWSLIPSVRSGWRSAESIRCGISQHCWCMLRSLFEIDHVKD